MIRVLLYLVLTVFVITILRSIIGVLVRGAGQLIGGAPAQTNRRPDVPAGGDLKRDPVCGTYISAVTSVKKNIGSEVVHFCSATCRDKFAGKTAAG
jgi:YHS domain-containing protein